MISFLIDKWNLFSGAGLPTLVALGLFAAAVASWIRIGGQLGHLIGAGLLAGGVGLLMRADGYMSARADCQDSLLRGRVAQLESDKKALQSRLEVSIRIEESAAARAQTDQQKVAELTETANALKKELEGRPAPAACAWTGDERRRLQSIRPGASRRAGADPASR